MNAIYPNSLIFKTERTCLKHYYTLYSGCNVYCLGMVNYRCSDIGEKLCNTGYSLIYLII